MSASTLDPRAVLSLLWVYLLLNFIYCDIIALHDAKVIADISAGRVGAIEITEGFLLASSVLMTIPISMVLLSRLLPRAASRWTSIAAASFMIVVQASSLLVGTVAANYAYFSAIEIAAMVAIITVAARTLRPSARPSAVPAV